MRSAERSADSFGLQADGDADRNRPERSEHQRDFHPQKRGAGAPKRCRRSSDPRQRRPASRTSEQRHSRCQSAPDRQNSPTSPLAAQAVCCVLSFAASLFGKVQIQALPGRQRRSTPHREKEMNCAAGSGPANAALRGLHLFELELLAPCNHRTPDELIDQDDDTDHRRSSPRRSPACRPHSAAV